MYHSEMDFANSADFRLVVFFPLFAWRRFGGRLEPLTLGEDRHGSGGTSSTHKKKCGF